MTSIDLTEDIVEALAELQRALVLREKHRETSTQAEMIEYRHRVDRARVQLDLVLMEAD